MKLATATAFVLATALSAFAHAESAVNEAPTQLLAMNQITAAKLPVGFELPVTEEMVVRADAVQAEKIEVVNLAMDKVAAQMEHQVLDRIARDLNGFY